MNSNDLASDLLFGIVARQNAFVSSAALLGALEARLADEERTVPAILVEREVLSPQERALIDALVELQRRRHGGSAEKSLAALDPTETLRDDLEQLAHPALEATLQYLPKRGTSLPPASGATASAAGRRGGFRYRTLRPHAQGGLGTVYVAEDLELQREVALKEIQEKFADHPVSRARFILEAQVTGALEHPGVVPVYGLGQYDDGRPFYAMRFIRGDSLKDAVEQFYRPPHGAVPPPASSLASGHASLDFRKLLGRFIDVCNAMEYAHSRGVLHRDLKPGNIMLGKYGETLVVDWGLAKVAGRDGADHPEDEADLLSASASGSTATQAGSVIGTPAPVRPAARPLVRGS